MNHVTTSALFFVFVLSAGDVWGAAGETNRKPNIVIIFSDDQGYGDLGVYGSEDLHTPNIDSIAQNGVRFTDGYVTGPVCVPSRVGLLTGNYQQRFGCDDTGDPPKSALMLSESLKKAGYTTGMIGKWHLSGREARISDNASEACLPLNRGFDEFFGFHYGGHWFLPGEHSPNAMFYKAFSGDIFRGDQVVTEKEYLTDAFGREAAAFIKRYRNEPFFLYIPFNAVHLPLEATDAYLEKYRHIKNIGRRTLAAMTASLDDAVGQVLKALRQHGLENDTLILYLSDNGGHPPANASLNGPLRGMKGELYEGGIRVPFLMQWKGVLPGGTVYRQPVIALDIYATSLAAAGESGQGIELDGKNLLPYLLGQKNFPPHESLYWRYLDKRALRQGAWKWVQEENSPSAELYHLENDIGEKNNLAGQRPDKLKELEKAYQKWDQQMKDPKAVSLTSMARLKRQGKWPFKKKE
ncbi:MAG: sulfatase-like hydrolase/transferase [Planctomycetota bacterium]